MLLALFLLLLAICAVALRLDTDTSGNRSEKAVPEQGWYPPIGIH